MTNRLRASYTILRAWEEGRTDDAIAMYLKLYEIDSPQMKAGREWHKKWQGEIESTGKKPEVFGEKKMEKWKTEWRIEVDVEDWMSLRGVIDLVEFLVPEGDTVIVEPTDFKTGMSSASDYANTYQLPLYAYLLRTKGLTTRRGIYAHYDQYQRKADTSYVWLTDNRLRDALEWAISIGSDMHNAFEQMGVYERPADLEVDIEI